MGMLSQVTDTESLESWKEMLAVLGDCGPDEIRVDACYELVDVLVRVAESSDDVAAVLAEAGTALAEIFGKFRETEEYGAILERMLDRAFMVPGGHVGLGALLGGIKIEDRKTDAHAYLALDVVRVALRYLHMRRGPLRDSRGNFLDVCYDALLRTALRNGLANLARIMEGGAARKEFCGSGSEICRMAMLRISIYDRRDVPSDAEILEVLRRYPAVSDVLDPKRVIESKGRLTRLIHYIALDHLVAREDHGWAYTAVAESNIRIRYWLDKIYRQHGISDDPERDVLDTITQKPALVTTNIMVSIRYLALEIHEFWKQYHKNHDLVKDLEIGDPSGIYKIVQECGDSGKMKEMRNKFGAHPEWTFKKAARHIDATGLDKFMLYAHLVLMFQDAVYRTIPSRHRREHVDCARGAQIPVTAEPVTVAEGKEFKERYGGASVAFGSQKSEDLYTTMQESVMCMMLLSANFNEAREHVEKKTLVAHLRFSNEVYNVKYMILELANFIEQYEKSGCAMTRAGEALVPNFLRRKRLYCEFRNSYAAHVRLGGINGIQELAGKNPSLISDVLRDIAEAMHLVARLASEFREYRECSIRAMTRMEIRQIQKRLDTIREESNGFYNNEFTDPDQGRTIQRRKEEVRRILGLK